MQAPIWTPGEDRIERANLSRFMRFVRAETGNEDLNSFTPLYRFSVEQPARFWTLVWDFCGIRGSGDRVQALAAATPGEPDSARWFPGTRLNLAQNLLRFDDERSALLWHGPDGAEQRLGYGALAREVAALAAALRAGGIGPGDRLLALLPDGREASVVFLAAAAVGATWAALPADAEPGRLATLAGALGPRLLVAAAADAGVALALAATLPGPVPCLLAGDDAPAPARSLAAYAAAHEGAAPEYRSLPFDHPLCATVAGDGDWLLHGAGGTLIEHLKSQLLHVDLKREDKLLAWRRPSDPDWTWAVSALAVGATRVIAPDADPSADPDRAWALAAATGTTVLAAAPAWFAASRRAGLVPRDRHRLLALKTLLALGGALPPEDMDHVYADARDRVLLASLAGGAGQLGHLALGAPLLPVQRGWVACRGLGLSVEVLDPDGASLVGLPGELCCTAPFPAQPLGYLDDPGGVRFRADRFRADGAWREGSRALLGATGGLVLGARADEEPDLA